MSSASATLLLPPLKAVLFDFDGTFADTAPDLAFAANRLRAAHGLDHLPLSHYRPHVSRGGRGMVWVAFGKTPADAEFVALRDAFLAYYAERLCEETQFFEGVDALIDTLEARGIAWGIVTNKAARYTKPIVETLGLHTRTPCIVSGDTTPHAKPHPAPLLHAASLLNIAPKDCWYIGDDERDMQAAVAAEMRAVVAGWGYLGGTDPADWPADAHAASPTALLAMVESTLKLSA
jgi:2-phosphoglycolate phosphatase